jgi:hypothetical protein
MSSTTKYQRAPQDEPEEDYTHAPPAYGEASASGGASESQGLFAGPRSSEDNVPDDFKVCDVFPCLFLCRQSPAH